MCASMNSQLCCTCNFVYVYTGQINIDSLFCSFNHQSLLFFLFLPLLLLLRVDISLYTWITTTKKKALLYAPAKATITSKREKKKMGNMYCTNKHLNTKNFSLIGCKPFIMQEKSTVRLLPIRIDQILIFYIHGYHVCLIEKNFL